jgi:hypothetical protein
MLTTFDPNDPNPESRILNPESRLLPHVSGAGPAAAAATPAPAARARVLIICAAAINRPRAAALCQQLAPVRHHVRTIAMQLDPCDRVSERAAVEDASLGSYRPIRLQQSGLQVEGLNEPLEIAARHE